MQIKYVLQNIRFFFFILALKLHTHNYYMKHCKINTFSMFLPAQILIVIHFPCNVLPHTS